MSDDYRIQSLERRIELMETKYDELDQKYVRLERYITVERIVFALIIGVVLTFGDVVYERVFG